MKNSIKQLLSCTFLLFSFSCISTAQNLSASRRVDWSVAGYGSNTPSYPAISITDFDADITGTSACNTAFNNALASLNGSVATIYFPAGTYFFNQSISLPGNIVLKGAGAGTTKLVFNLNGALEDLIKIEGSEDNTTTLLTAGVAKDATTITVQNAAGFAPGNYIKINQNDAGLITSTWAQGTVGQLVQIAAVNGNVITLATALRKGYNLGDAPKITKLNMKSGNGIECLTIKRLDATSWQTSNIMMRYAAKCWVKGVESDSCNYAHICLENATNVEVSASYFHGAFAYGGNGQGYGVIMQSTSGGNLIENNVFKHLRHSMLLQSGANGNVMAYNYSIEPYWTEVSLMPSNAAGDMVLHGNYPYANLFEGNIGQNMVIDNSHGKNGPFNTFFRNRGNSYGLVMNTGAGDSTNIIGNEIPNAITGFYILTGSGNYTYGNNVKGVAQPVFTSGLTTNSLYKSATPAYFTNHTYPSVGYPNTISTGTIPAASRFTAGTAATCTSNIITTPGNVLLPITLLNFVGTILNNYVDLKWKANDQSGDKYVVERSIDGEHFSNVTTVLAKEKSAVENDYMLTTLQLQPKAWYRLQLVDKDGKTAYSKQVVLIVKEASQNAFSIIGNPVSSLLQIKYNIANSGNATLTVSNSYGSNILQKNISLSAGSGTIQQNVHSLATGIYFIRLADEAGKPVGNVQKMIKL